jgi:drug/metabolite transporter (DMT)-like permease
VNLGILRCGIAAILFGISAPAASRLTDDMGPFALAGLLYLGAAIAVVPIVARSRQPVAALRATLPNLSLAVILGGLLGPVLLAVGLDLVPAATASLLLNLELVFTTLIAGVVFHEHLGGRVIAGTVLVGAGGAVLAGTADPDLRWGALVIAGACFCWAIDNSATASIDQITPSTVTLAKGIIAGGTNFAIGVRTDGLPDTAALLAALMIGAIGYGASITLWVAGARDLGAARGQLVFAAAPFVGAAVAWTFLPDPVTTRELVAFSAAAAGVALVSRSTHEHTHEHERLTHTHEHGAHHAHLHEPPITGRHTHPHQHEPLTHRHPHIPDLHHRHRHP